MKNKRAFSALLCIEKNYAPPIQYMINPDLPARLLYVDIEDIRIVRSYEDYQKSLTLQPRMLKCNGQWVTE